MPPQANTPQDPFGQIVDKLKSANNVLVTVSSNPSVDQLSACIGVTLALNKLGKHATAVYSGRTPAAIEFLEPGKTLESNTDSLRDFIIALDKAKADKLRYKVEDEVVRIFITPYKTSISDKDLEFSQGDFNVDAVLALGVHKRSDLDQAIVSHGRILHDAAVLSINTVNQNELGSIDWTDGGASSLCEMASDIVSEFGKDVLDTQIATALLTGIVAETNRFSNEKASPHTMSVSGTLMAGGASTQLVASKLEEAVQASVRPRQAQEASPPNDSDEPNPDGMIQIEHDVPPSEESSDPEREEEPEPEPPDDIHIDDHGTLRPVREYLTEPPASEKKAQEEPSPDPGDRPAMPNMVLEPPILGGALTSSDLSEDQQEAGVADPLSASPPDAPLLSRSAPQSDSTSPPPESDLVHPDKLAIDDSQTLTDIERAVDSAHLKTQQISSDDSYRPEPIAALNAQDFGIDLGHNPPVSEPEPSQPASPPPPPVPPPMMPPSANG